MSWITLVLEPVVLLALVVAAGLPLLLLPGPAGLALSAVGVALVAWANHRLEESLRRLPARVGPESMIGQTAVALERLDPAGTVRCGGEVWRALVVRGRRVAPGEKVRVVHLRGLRLEVDAVETDPPSSA